MVQVGSSGVEQLLVSLNPNLRLLHLCGEQHKETEATHAITRIVVYRSRPVEAPDLSLAAGSVALIHSPRAARRFAELAEERDSIVIAAISQTAAEAAGTGWKAIRPADRPTDEALLALAARLCNNRP